MALYDIHGNQIATGGGSVISKVGLADLSEEIVNKVIVVDDKTPIFNLLDISEVVVGRPESSGNVNSWFSGERTSDFIQVNAGQTYVAQSWDAAGTTGDDNVWLFDTNKALVKKIGTGGNGTIRYCIFTPEENGYIRYAYHHSETANPMVYVGIATTEIYVPYTGETITGEVMYEVANEFRGMIRRDVEPSNLYGKTVYIIGDSNSDNWASGTAKELEKRYGCTVIGLGKYGATWATTTDVNDTALSNAIGQWNKFVATVGIDQNTYRFPDDVVLLFMMGTNAGNGTFNASNEDVTTPGGAINYILKRAKYYGRNMPIGIFLPWCASNNDQLAKAAEHYKIPYFDIPAIIMDDAPTSGLTRPDGSTVSQNYISDGANHLATYGWEMFRRIAHPWIAYEI